MPNEGRYLNLAETIAEILGEYDKAIDYFEKTLNSDLASFGEGHPTIARTRNNLGSVWYSKDENGKAIDCFEQALRITLNTLGENHPTTKTTQQNLLAAQAEIFKKD